MPLRLVDLTQRYDIHDLNYRDPPMKLANNNSQNSIKMYKNFSKHSYSFFRKYQYRKERNTILLNIRGSFLLQLWTFCYSLKRTVRNGLIIFLENSKFLVEYRMVPFYL